MVENGNLSLDSSGLDIEDERTLTQHSEAPGRQNGQRGTSVNSGGAFLPSSSGRKPCSLISLRPTGAVESASESLLETFSPSACVANRADDKEATAIMTSNDLMLHLWEKSNTLMHDTIHTDPCVMLTYFLATTPEEVPGEIAACQSSFRTTYRPASPKSVQQ